MLGAELGLPLGAELRPSMGEELGDSVIPSQKKQNSMWLTAEANEESVKFFETFWPKINQKWLTLCTVWSFQLHSIANLDKV